MEIFSRIPVTLLLLLSACGVIFGDYMAKVWSINQKTTFLILAFFGYLLSSLFYIPTLLREGLVVTSVIWSLLSIIGFVIIGLVLFKESLNTTQMIGVILGLVALIILTFTGR